MLKGLIGLIAAVLGLAAVAVLRPEFLHLPSLFLTIGGSVGVIFTAYSPRQVREFYQVSRQLFSEKSMVLQEYTDELSRLTALYRVDGLRGLELAERRVSDRFLRRAIGMLVDLKKEEKIYAALERDIAKARGGHDLSREILLTLSKLLPAFGLIGTLIGMVVLLRNVYSQDIEMLPAALSLAVLTTLYGAVLANVVVAPFTTKLQAVAAEKERRMGLTLEWVMMIVRNDVVTSVAHNRVAMRSGSKNRYYEKEREWTPSFQSPQ